MKQWTEAELKQFAPNALQEYVDALVNGWGDIQKAGISTPLRLCEFLAQIAHETGSFTILRENTNWSAKRMCELWPNRFSLKDPTFLAKYAACGKDPAKKAELAYGGRKDLGNTEKGDGWLFRGACFMQDTGRACAREYGKLVGMDFEGNPSLLEKPSVSLKVALTRWKKLDLNRFADRHYSRVIGNAINRGPGRMFSSKDPIGFEGRNEQFERAWLLFGDGNIPHDDTIALGAYGSQVEVLQRRLKELNYPVGSPDKVFGPVLARAVAAFKLDHKRATGAEMEPDEIVGTKTWQALGRADVVEHGERADTTERELAEAGSEEIKTGQQQKAVGTAITVASAAKAAQETGMLDQAQQQLSWIPQVHSFMVPVIEAVSWGFKNAFWVLTLVGGVWFWTRGKQIISARLKAHRFGFNLFR